MDAQLERPIKEVINEFPEVGAVLDSFGIGCVPCAVGSCLLGSVVSIHGLSPEQETELMAQIGRIIGGGAAPDSTPASVSPEAQPAPASISYSPAVKRLVDEHTLIKRFIAAVPGLIQILDLESEEGRRVVLDGVHFIRTYADAFHHAKEEDILFGYADEDSEVIQVMLEDHTTARGHVRAIVEGVEARAAAAVTEHLVAYAALLTDHIKREDEILYPWIDRTLSTRQNSELFAQFDAADAAADPAAIQRCQAFIEDLEAGLPIDDMAAR
jgi:hemerythrin-like domain-containing protein